MQSELFTYNITGGTPFVLQLPGNPSIEHDGGESTGHVYLTPLELHEVSSYIISNGSTFKFWRSTRQSEEQKEERQKLLGFQKEDAVFPTHKCPTCAWFDPLTEKYCGLSDWPPESIEILMSKPHHIQHSKECPSPNYWTKDTIKTIIK